MSPIAIVGSLIVAACVAFLGYCAWLVWDEFSHAPDDPTNAAPEGEWREYPNEIRMLREIEQKRRSA